MMSNFSRELNNFHIEYALRVSQKGQEVSNFIVELHIEDPAYPICQNTFVDSACWTLFFDVSNNMHGANST